MLRELGGWDAWNVTEDADLGIRIATARYRVADLPSTTLEEAPRRLRPWLRQRARWMKGFAQVAITHSRRPLANARALGLPGFLTATALSLGTFASALGFPVFLALAASDLASGDWFKPSGWLDLARTGAGLLVFACGMLAMVAPPLAGIRRRRLRGLWPLALLMPFYYVLVSVAAWRGLYELLVDPDRWNKTEHGLAETSRSAERRET